MDDDEPLPPLTEAGRDALVSAAKQLDATPDAKQETLLRAALTFLERTTERHAEAGYAAIRYIPDKAGEFRYTPPAHIQLGHDTRDERFTRETADIYLTRGSHMDVLASGFVAEQVAAGAITREEEDKARGYFRDMLVPYVQNTGEIAAARQKALDDFAAAHPPADGEKTRAEKSAHNYVFHNQDIYPQFEKFTRFLRQQKLPYAARERLEDAFVESLDSTLAGRSAESTQAFAEALKKNGMALAEDGGGLTLTHGTARVKLALPTLAERKRTAPTELEYRMGYGLYLDKPDNAPDLAPEALAMARFLVKSGVAYDTRATIEDTFIKAIDTDALLDAKETAQLQAELQAAGIAMTHDAASLTLRHGSALLKLKVPSQTR